IPAQRPSAPEAAAKDAGGKEAPGKEAEGEAKVVVTAPSAPSEVPPLVEEPAAAAAPTELDTGTLPITPAEVSTTPQTEPHVEGELTAPSRRYVPPMTEAEVPVPRRSSRLTLAVVAVLLAAAGTYLGLQNGW